jgi:glycosyltransferase involved in cell wall biosynthesis
MLGTSSCKDDESTSKSHRPLTVHAIAWNMAPMIRVLLEPEAFRHPRCGVARYWSAVCRGLRDAGLVVDLPLVGINPDTATDAPPTEDGRGTIAGLRDGLRAQAHKLSHRLFLHKLRHECFDVVLPTAVHPDAEVALYAERTPLVLVCHDTMRSLPIPGGAIDGWSDPLYRLLYLARRAVRIICVSECTRRDLLAADPSLAGRTVVVPTGNLLSVSAPVGAPLRGLPKRYLLFVGSRQTRKNFHGLILSVAPLLRATADLRLVCTGSFSRWEMDFLRAQGVAHVVCGVQSTDAELVTLYQGALALVYPSFYEGFGLPVLEAMSLGCPVIASGTSSLPELAGDAALFVDPGKPESIRRAVERMLREPDLRARLSLAGRERARSFSCESMLAGLVREITAGALLRTA